jgi:hypothetical protein
VVDLVELLDEAYADERPILVGELRVVEAATRVRLIRSS